MNVRSEDLDERLQEFEERLGLLEKRVSRVEGQLQEHTAQFTRLDQRLIDLKDSLAVERRRARLEAQAGIGKE